MNELSDNGIKGWLPSLFYGATDAELQRWFVIGWFLLTGFRVLILVALPLDFSGDEAYYWEWGQHLDWGYYSKPPGIGWLMALAGAVGGNTTIGIRLFAVVLGSGGLWFLYILARRLYGIQTGIAAAMLFALLPASAALNLVVTIDAPLMFCWMGALLAFWRFVESEGRSPVWGTSLALFLAGGILSKQMMLAFYPLALLFLTFSPHRRIFLRKPAIWAVFLLSLMALLPPLYWNSQNQWVTFHHTLHHLESGDTTLLGHFVVFMEFVGASIGLVTPVLWVLIMGLILVSVVSWKYLEERERYLWLFSAPGLLTLTLMALRQNVYPNWPAVFLPAAVVLTTAWAAGHWSPGNLLTAWRRAFGPAYRVAVLFFCLTYGIATAFSLEWLAAPRFDPLLRVRGWLKLAAEIEMARDSLPNHQEVIIITQGHRFITSELAFYLPDHPRVYRFNCNPEIIYSQHDLWETPADHLGKDALIVVQGPQDNLAPELTSRFESVRFLKVIDERRRYNRLFTLFKGRNLLSWPQRAAFGRDASK